MNAEPSRLTEMRERAAHGLIWLGAAWVLMLVVRNAWLSDDAYITLRRPSHLCMDLASLVPNGNPGRANPHSALAFHCRLMQSKRFAHRDLSHAWVKSTLKRTYGV